MLLSKIKALLRPAKQALTKPSDSFLSDVSGVIHVGANYGQERKQYNSLGLRVVWVEPIPEVYTALEENIREFSDQQACQALVTDNDGKEYQFHISNNGGSSSSILEFKYHRDIWPDVAYTNSITLQSITLPSLLKKEQINPGDYQALIMDTQGSELLILQGSIPVLHHFKYIKTEVANFESYKGCCQVVDINAFMKKHGYSEYSRNKFASRKAGGHYFDIVFKKKT